MNWLKIRHIFRVLGSFIGTSILTYIIFEAVEELRDVPEPVIFHVTFIIPALFMTLFSYLMQMINYHCMVASLGGNPKINHIVIGYAYSFLHKYIPGSIWGYFSRAEWYDSEASIPPTHSWGASVLEIIITVSTSASIWLVYHLATRNSSMIFLLLVVLIPFVVVLPINGLISLLQKTKRDKRLATNLRAIPFLNWILITVNSYLQWIFFGLGLCMIFHVFSLEITITFNDIAVFIYSFARAWITGFLTIFVPTGLGVREVVLKELLSTANQISSAKSVLIATTYRLVTIGAELGWVLLVVLLKRRLLFKK